MRETNWLQGLLLTKAQAVDLGLVSADATDERVVVISHDCDLRNEAEDDVEVIVGKVVERSDPIYCGAKHPRVLHVNFTQKDKSLCIQFEQVNKAKIKFARLAQLGAEDQELTISLDEKRCLKQWLAARYGRPAFPNEFEKHLRIESRKKRSVEYWIAKTIERGSQYLTGIFFDLGEDRNVELKDEPYSLSIFIVYDAIEGGAAARAAAEKIAEEMDILFNEAYGKPQDAKTIALDKCQAIADTHFSLAQVVRMDQWRVEFLSFREDPPGWFAAQGG